MSIFCRSEAPDTFDSAAIPACSIGKRKPKGILWTASSLKEIHFKIHFKIHFVVPFEVHFVVRVIVKAIMSLIRTQSGKLSLLNELPNIVKCGFSAAPSNINFQELLLKLLLCSSLKASTCSKLLKKYLQNAEASCKSSERKSFFQIF